MENLHNAMSDALHLSQSLYNNQSTFFLGAGFSKGVKLPSFWELVRDRILVEFIDDLVKNGTEEEWTELLDIKEFKPKNCLECFIASFTGGLFQDKKMKWSSLIQYGSFTNSKGEAKTFQDVLENFVHLLVKHQSEESEAYKFIQNLPDESSELYEIHLEKLPLLVDNKIFNWSNSKTCSRCMKSQWNDKNRSSSSYILGLLQAYLEQGKFQIVNLLEYIQYSMDKKGVDGDGKMKIAKYAFDGNPQFKKFDKLIEEYHKCPENSITDSQIALARLSKEGLIHQIITTNWDDLMELACYALDMYVKTNDGRVFGLAGEELSPSAEEKLEYKHYINHAVSISEKEDYYDSNFLLAPTKKTFYLYKIHGGIDKILENFADDEGYGEKDLDVNNQSKEINNKRLKKGDKDWNFVITHRDLADWRDDQWSKDLVNSILRSHDIIFTGISGGDNVIYTTIRRIFEELSNIFSVSNDGKICTNRVNNEDLKASKRVFAININKELVLSNMITGRAGIEGKYIILDTHIKSKQSSGENLFYRWLYVFYILKYSLGNAKTDARKMIEYISNGENIYLQASQTEETIGDFIEKMFDVKKFQPREGSDGEKLQRLRNLQLEYMDVFYDVVPKLIIYTWLLNNHLSSIRAETDNKNFLLKKPHFYLPVLTYSKWFTMYLLIFAKLYDYIANPMNKVNNIKITQDGVIILNGVAILLMVTAEPRWENLRQVGTQAFSKQSLEYMNRSWKKAIIIWNVQKSEKDQMDKEDKYIMNHKFKPYYLTYECLFTRFDKFMNEIFSIEEEG